MKRWYNLRVSKGGSESKEVGSLSRISWAWMKESELSIRNTAIVILVRVEVWNMLSERE